MSVIREDDVFGHLETALGNWSVEIAETGEELDRRLSALRVRVVAAADAVPPADAAAAGASPELETALADLAATQAQLTLVQEESARATALRNRVPELEELLERERSRSRLLEERLERERAEGANSETARKLAGALRDRDEAHQEIVALRAEVDLLRRVNANLTMPAAGNTEETANTEPSFLDRVLHHEDGQKRRMGEILIAMGMVTAEQVATALVDQASRPHRRIGTILIENGHTSEEIVAQVLARQLDLPFMRLVPALVEEDAAHIISGQLARRRCCIPIALSPGRVVLAMANPFDLVALDDVEMASGRRAEPVVATPGAIASAIARFYDN